MRVTSTKSEKGFEPFNLTFRIENEEDAIKLFCLFNHTFISDSLGVTNLFDHVRFEINKNCGIVGYIKCFDEFDEKMKQRFKRGSLS